MDNSLSSPYARVTELRKRAGLTQKAFADRLQVSQAYVSSLEKGKRELSRNMIDQLVEVFGVTPNWLLGEAESADTRTALAPDTFLEGKRERVVSVTVDAANEPAVVLVPVKAQAGYALNRVEPTYLNELPTLQLPDQRFRNGTFRAFEIAGDSMDPTLYGGDVVVCSYVQDWRWLRDMELYVVVMREDVLVKRVRNHLRQDGTLELVSDNRFYPPFHVPADEVLEVWQVFARLTFHLPAPRSLQHP